MNGKLVLVVDDDENVRNYLASLLESLGYEVRGLASGEKALACLASGPPPAVILLDLAMPGIGGLETLDRIKVSHPRVPVVVLSMSSDIGTVVDAIRRGASDYLTKSFQDQELQIALQNAIEKQQLRGEVATLRRRLDRDEGGFVSASARILRIKEIGRQVADTDAPVLVLGESGVGKEVVARFIHAQSRRSGQAFMKVNCAALPDDLLESELFGYEKGAFSGAMHLKPGLFELADGGTILLDEIGEMTYRLQAKLLHVLQDGEFTRLGGRQVVRVDARVMAATNVHIDEAVAAGRFREDLFFRLNVIRLEVPSLRDRREDVPMLAAHFLRHYAQRYRTAVRELPAAVQEAFLAHDWPGNVRELENAVRRYVILGDGEAVLAELRRGRRRPDATAVRSDATGGRSEDHGPAAAATRTVASAPAPVPAEREASGWKEGVSLRTVAARAAEEAERHLLRRVLAETRWNRREAALRLKISYKALLNKLKKWDVDEPRREPAAPHPIEAAPRLREEPLRPPFREEVLVAHPRWPRTATR